MKLEEYIEECDKEIAKIKADGDGYFSQCCIQFWECQKQYAIENDDFEPEDDGLNPEF